MIYSNGDEFNGKWVNNSREGEGILKFKNGNEIRGEWKNDNLIKGKMTHFNGDEYEGNIF